MKKKEALNHVFETVSKKQDNIKEKFTKTRFKARCLKIGIIVISLLSTVLLGLDMPKVILVIVSSIVVASNLIDGILNYSDKAVQEHSYYLQLSTLKEKILFYKDFTDDKDIEEKKISDFFDEYNNLRYDFHSKRIISVKQSLVIDAEDTKEK